MKGSAPKILYVEDDVNLGFVTTDNLNMNGYKTVYCKDGKEALEIFDKDTFDLCILDIMLPETDGFAIARAIRERNKSIPIIFLTAKAMKEDRITGFKTGADDYITKPFNIEELVLRIEVFLKRSTISGENSLPLKFTIGNYLFDFENLALGDGKSQIQLTLKEAELLRFFCMNTNKVLKREDILRSLWGDDDYFMGRSLDVFISRLRKHLKLEPAVYIENIHGVGFRMNTDK